LVLLFPQDWWLPGSHFGFLVVLLYAFAGSIWLTSGLSGAFISEKSKRLKKVLLFSLVELTSLVYENINDWNDRSSFSMVNKRFIDTVSWLYKQGEAVDKDKLRPDILIHAEQLGKVVEVTCREVKNIDATQEKLNEDKMRVLEVMKRQFQTRLRHAKSSNEAVTFGILVQGKSSKCLA
jgi:hypothetical protein